MASAVRQADDGVARLATTAAGGVPVILDGGASVRVAAIDVGRPLRVGLRFEFEGAMWEIARENDHARGWVARPARTYGRRTG